MRSSPANEFFSNQDVDSPKADQKLAQTCTEPETVGYEYFTPSELQSQVKIELIKPRNGIHYNINGRQDIVPETRLRHPQRLWQGATSP